MEKKQIKRELYLDIARTLAVILIALNHAANRAFDNYNNQLVEFEALSMAETIFKATITVASRLGVPLFLMITGALMFRKRFDKAGALSQFYRQNWFRLFLTSEIWLFIMYWFVVIGRFPRWLSWSRFPILIVNLVKTMLFIDPITFGSIWYIPMILALYLMLPIVVQATQQLSLKVLILPTILVIIDGMVFPNINELLVLLGLDYQIDFTINFSNVFSVYFPYVIAGYWVSIGALSRLSDTFLTCVTTLLFVLSVAYQVFAYASPINYLLTYNFFVFLFIATGIFELIRRYTTNTESGTRVFSYISVRTFAIYFIHIIVMSVLLKVPTVKDWSKSLLALYLEVGSLVVSLLLIAMMERIRWMKRYLLYM